MKYQLFVFVLLVVFACGEKRSEGEAETEDDVEWKEMDEFHAVMSDMYHPLKDSGNLEPIRKDAGRLAAAATKWAQSTLPSKVDNEETKEMLARLEDGCQQLMQMINDKMPDEEIASKLTAQHDNFHAIMETWYKAGKEEGAEEHHDH